MRGNGKTLLLTKGVHWAVIGLMTSPPNGFAVTRHPQAEPFPARLFSDRGGSCEDRLRG
jgi:hypothetical protein